MYIQTEQTPNPNSLKFLPGKVVSNRGSFEITEKNETDNELVRNLLGINGVESIFLGKDFISLNKYDHIEWEEIKHIVNGCTAIKSKLALTVTNVLLYMMKNTKKNLMFWSKLHIEIHGVWVLILSCR